MKTLIRLICLAVFVGTVFAADPVVTIPDKNTCLVDGKNWGRPGDVMANNPKLVPAVNVALDAFHAKADAERDVAIKKAQDAAAAAIEKAQSAAAAAIEKAQKESASEIEKADIAIKAAESKASNDKNAAWGIADKASLIAAKESARVATIVAALKSVTMGPLPPVVAQAIVDEDTKLKALLQAQKAEIEKRIATLTQ